VVTDIARTRVSDHHGHGFPVCDRLFTGFHAGPVGERFTHIFLKGLYFSATTFLTIGYGDIQPPTQTVAFAAGIEGFLGLFLMSYFTVAIVRKLLR
jgi:hypothetical protein